MTVVGYAVLFFISCKIQINELPLALRLNTFLVPKGGTTHLKFQEFSNKEPFNYVFVGSSRCNQAYDPSIFERKGLGKSFNLGSYSQTFSNSVNILESCLDSSNCKNLIIDIYPNAFFKSDLESSIDLITNANEKLGETILINDYTFQKLNALLFQRFSSDLESSPRPVSYNYNGHLKNEETFSGRVQSDSIKVELKFNKEHRELISKAEALCKMKSINLFFCISPVSSFKNNDGYAQMLRFFKENISETSEIIDMSDIEIDSRLHFYDRIHLNYKGSQIFTGRLSEYFLN